MLGILPTLNEGRSTHSGEVLEDVGERYGLPVLSPRVRYRVVIDTSTTPSAS